MQRIGRKSIFKNVSIENLNGEKPYRVRVQANKNYGICDLVLCDKIVDRSDKKKIRTYYKVIRRLPEPLSEFQGRQINDELTMEHLQNVLFELLNA